MTSVPARTPPPQADGGLAALSATGDFEAFVGTNFGRLLRTAYLLTRDHAQAEELVQLTLTEVRLAWPRISHDRDRLVRQVMSNVLTRISRGP